jgi:hypothetical protein
MRCVWNPEKREKVQRIAPKTANFVEKPGL